jgi:hypothetical protein
MLKFLERCTKIDSLKDEIKPLHLTLFDLHIPYMNEAVECFHKKLPISCIVVSSALIEICLCWEHWRRKPEEQRKNIPSDEFIHCTLTPLIKEFGISDIPLDKLLDFDEKEKLGKLENKEKRTYLGNSIRYVLTRNKFAHGDLLHHIPLCLLISGHEKDWLDYGINDDEWSNATLETVAYVQLLKTLRFIKAFTGYLIEKEEMKNK